MEFALATLFHSEKGNEIKISKTIISKGPAKAKGAMEEVMDEVMDVVMDEAMDVVMDMVRKWSWMWWQG